MHGKILNIQKFCLHDGPGIRTTVFFLGCPLRCRWCANPESQFTSPQVMYDRMKCLLCGNCVRACHNNSIKLLQDRIEINRKTCDGCGACVEVCNLHGGRALSLNGMIMTVSEVVEEILKDEVFYRVSGGGVTLSGGEILTQIDFIEALAKELREKNIHIACETTGFSSEAKFKRLLRFTDLLLFDIKHYDSKKHQWGTGVDNNQILENLRLALSLGKELIVRIPVVPGFNDSLEDALAFGKLCQRYGIKEAHLLPFHQFGLGKYEKLDLEYYYSDYSSVEKEDLTEYAEIIRKFIAKVQIGG